MKSIRSLVLAKSIAAALVASAGLAAPVISHASPDDGMTCRPGYNGQTVGGVFKCSRVVTRVLPLDCPLQGPFTRKQIRSIDRVSGSDGRDVCTREQGLTIASNSSLAGLTEKQDFVFAAFADSRLASTVKAVEIAEERNLSLADDQVDVTATHGVTTGQLVIDASTGAIDGVQATITLFTFPIPAVAQLRPIVPVTPVVTLPAPKLP